MNDRVKAAQQTWGVEEADAEFVAGRENQVYRLRADGIDLALRLKRVGYRSKAELISELEWLEAMTRAGLSVPCPVPSRNGRLLEQIDGCFVDVVQWLGGHPLGTGRAPLELSDGAGTFFRLGRDIARLHTACDQWALPACFTRWAWDAEGLLGEAPVWGRFWDNPQLDADTKDLFLRFRGQALAELDQKAADLDFGLIHADLVRENVMLDGDRLHFLDFDDGGFGYRLFDLATVLLNIRSEAEFPALKSALIDGYSSLRALDLHLLDLFMALRAVTYVGWIVPRIGEPGSDERSTRFVLRARDLCAQYLDS